MPLLTQQDEALFDKLLQKHYTALLRYTWILVRRMGALEIGANIVEDAIQDALLFLEEFRTMVSEEESHEVA